MSNDTRDESIEVTADATFAVVPTWVLDAEISDRALRLYAVLARYANSSGQTWPSRATLAERLRCSRDSVDRALRELVEVGALSVHNRTTSSGDLTSNLYVVRSVPVGGGRTRAARVAAPVRQGGRTRAAENENHSNESQRNEVSSSVADQPQEHARAVATTIQRRLKISADKAAAVAQTVLDRFAPDDLARYVSRMSDADLRAIVPVGDGPPSPADLCDHGRGKHRCPWCAGTGPKIVEDE